MAQLIKKHLLVAIVPGLFLLGTTAQKAESADKAKDRVQIMALSQGHCVKSYKAVGSPNAQLESNQVGVPCDIALIEDFPNGTSLSQFGDHTKQAPEIGFISKRDPKRSDKYHFYGDVTQVIYSQQHLPVKSGWCLAELTPPSSDKPKKGASSGSWKASCVAIASAKVNGELKKFVTNVNFDGSLPQPLPQLPQPLTSYNKG